MIKLKWMELANPYFQDAVRVIWDCPMLDAPTSYSAHRIYSGVAKVEKEIKDLRIALIDKYAKKGEDGKPLTDPRGHIQFASDEVGKEFEAEFQKEFESRCLELKVARLDFRNLTNVRGITPRQWEYLKPIVDNLPEEPADEEPELESSVLELPKRRKKSK